MKRVFRKHHRLIAISICVPLSLSVVTGIGITIAEQWLHQEELVGLLIKVHTLEILGLAAIYPLLNGLAVIGLIVTGLSMTSLFSQRHNPKSGGDRT
ncbi:MAG: peptidase [Stigonema ocellatum SAG 48.90 = DSM 106950]|nr:peptidase [Stigonema ocellatum SAG 48.90 = DSM 106950]